jgi:TolB protein
MPLHSIIAPLSLMCASLAFGHSNASAQSIGAFAQHGDVGDPAIPGAVAYHAADQSYRMSAAGTNLWGAEDEFHFAWNEMEGDFILRARVEFIGDGVDPHRKAGWMVRADLDTGSVYADGTVHGDGLTSLQYRGEKDGETAEVILENLLNGTYPDVIQLERRGGVFIFSAARYGEPLKSVTFGAIDLPDRVHVGLFLCSHNAEVVEHAIFRDVRIIKPAAPDFRPYSDYLGATMEILDVHTGELRSILQSNEPFEAPNWTHDGQKLIVNVSGAGPNRGILRTIDLATGEVARLPTGPAVRNNNDHVLSFDGTQLAISNHEGDDWTSTIYTLPATGSDSPTQVTKTEWGHSFLHGWSPDASKLIYTAQRNDQWDIYQVDIATRTETQLTDNPALDDGSEFTPDGKWIYFNSTRGGTMDIWRMRPNGADPEPVTDDELNNWFPHPSPDGKWLVFLSYGTDVEPSDHPYYKHVTLRLMPLDGSAPPRVIAYVYGGQGTINVPSWSPDSQRIAFVSNSG